jgi:ABC-type multidrug transport system fused ATPase/permease subunit
LQATIDRLRDVFWPEAAEDDDVVRAAHARPLREIVRHFWPDVHRFRGWLAALLLFAAVGPALETATIWLYKLLVDEVLVPGDLGLFPGIALAYLGLTLLGGLVSFGDSYLSDWTSERFTLGLRTRVYAQLQRMSPDFYAERRRGDLLARLTDDVDDVESLVVSGAVDVVSYLARIIFFTSALFLLSW